MSVVGRRVVVRALGETPMDALEHHVALEPQPRPDPSSLGPHDVLLAVRACAVGWVDLLMTSGQYQHLREPPYTPGLEYAGEVAAIGSAVTRCTVGDSIMVDPFTAGPRTSGRYATSGGFASWAVIPEAAAWPRPAGLDDDQACNLLGSYETAVHCLVARGRLQPGETVLIHGASGATGLAAVHVARRVGARVIATGRNPDKLAIVEAEGADHVVCTRGLGDDPPRLRDAIKRLTDGRGVDVVYDGVGGPISVESLRCVRFGARYLIVGWAATPFVARGRGGRGAPNANVLPTNLIMMKGLDVLGCPTVIATQHDPSIRAARLEQIFGWVADGLRPRVSRTFGLDAFAEAMRAKWNGAWVGGGVVHPPHAGVG